jgi:futalosine hydrolase
MRILVVAATGREIGHLGTVLRCTTSTEHTTLSSVYRGHDVDIFITSVGMVATAAWTSRLLTQTPYSLALNFGLCGTFDRTLALGSVVHVASDRFAELGAEDDERFISIQQMQLLGLDEFPFTGGQLVNAAPPPNPALRRLRSVSGITVNTVHGNERSIAAVVQRFAPQVESMEGAAFMYACLIHHVSFAQVRAVSNIVETRNRSAWQVDEAISALGAAAVNILDHA